jgi:hypothetical protein
MKMVQDQFTEKFGNPAKFSFRGQCYDGRTPTTACICGRKIRFCFVAFTGAEQRVVLGSCCFKHFAGTRMADILEAEQVHLLNIVVEAQKAEKRAIERQAFEDSRKVWNKVRREAISLIAAHRKATGKGWLPEALWNIETALASPQPPYRQSTRAAKWFLTKTEYLRKRLAEADQVGIMGDEVPAHNQGQNHRTAGPQGQPSTKN